MLLICIALASIALTLIMLWGFEKYSLRQSDEPTGDRPKNAKRRGKATFDKQAAAPKRPVGTRYLLSLALAAVVLAGVFWGLSGAGKLGQGERGASEERGSISAQSSPDADVADLKEQAASLARELSTDPKNGKGWRLLGETYGKLQRFAEADAAYAKAAPLLPAEAGLLADWADNHVMAQGQQWDDQGRRLLKQAMALDPTHLKTLALVGSEAYARGDYRAAIAAWSTLKEAAPAGSMYAGLADANLAEAREKLSGTPALSSQALDPAAAVGGEITLDSKFKGKVSAGDTVFVVARTPDGSGPPLAVARYRATDLPVRFRLDDSSALLPGRTISQYNEVLVSAKISRSGSAHPAKGDIFAPAVRVKLGEIDARLELAAER